MDIFERILPFRDYFSLMLKAGKSRFWQLLGTMLLLFAISIVLMIICMIPIGIILAGTIPMDLLYDNYAMANYFYSDEFMYQILTAIPAMLISMAIFILAALLISSVQYSMVYLITDSYINGEKRSFGQMFSYSIKRAFPVTGTSVLLTLMGIGIAAVFCAVFFGICSAMGVDVYSAMYYQDLSVLDNGAFLGVMILMYLLLLAVCMFIGIIYSFSVTARVKYKLSAIETLRYSRRITKGKRVKLLGNYLLMGLIFVGIIIVLSIIFAPAVQNNNTFVTLILDIISAVIGIFVSVFWTVIFINFDKATGQAILENEFPQTIYLKDQNFPDNDKTGGNNGDNLNNE